MSSDTGRLIILTLSVVGILLFGWNTVLRWAEISVERFIQWLGFMVFLAGVATRNAYGLAAIGSPWDIVGIWLQIIGLAAINVVILITGLALLVKRRNHRGLPQ